MSKIYSPNEAQPSMFIQEKISSGTSNTSDGQFQSIFDIKGIFYMFKQEFSGKKNCFIPAI